jgi:hypothetical protein
MPGVSSNLTRVSFSLDDSREKDVNSNLRDIEHPTGVPVDIAAGAGLSRGRAPAGDASVKKPKPRLVRGFVVLDRSVSQIYNRHKKELARENKPCT